jgi:glycosyltransferase involved in cell wall biosynthesis
MSAITVSVLMTVYNREKYLAEAIESVLASTLTNFELIIVDDVSTDKSFDIASHYAADDSRIKLYKNKINLGDYPNRNQAAAYATGKYIKYIDSDDAIFDWGLEYCVERMEQHPNAALGTLTFNNNLKELCVGSELIIHEHFFAEPLLNIGPSGTIFRRDAFEKVGFFDTRFGIASDTFLNLKLASSFPVVLLPKVFFFYRQHEGQQLHNSFFAYLLNNYLYQKELLREKILPISAERSKFLERKNSRNFLFNLLKAIPFPNKWSDTIKVAKAANIRLRELY